MTESIHQLVQELIDAWNTRDVDRVAALYAAEYVGTDIGEAQPQLGQQGVRQTLRRYLQAFPDLHFDLNQTIVDGNQAALCWTARGIHGGSLMNIPPTGRTIAIQGISVITVVEGSIITGLYIWDLAGLLRSIGLLPEL